MRDELSADEMRAWAPQPETSPPPADLRLPGYSGFQLVAQGGEGSVYRARQDGLGRDVAIKALQVVDPATQARFRRELEITVRLGRQHPHIVTVLDTGTLPDGRPCIVMEFYDLGSLHDRLRAHGPLPVAEVVAAGTAVSDALAFAHGQGFLHRDVKPQNVLVLPTSYVLADFGIARGADAGHSASLQMVSYRHAAPQMIAGEAPAAADDLWSLGSTLFTLLTGHPPFAGVNPDEDTVLSYLDRVRAADPRPLTRSDVPRALAEIIARCLSKRREDRFPDATALRDALAGVGTDLRRWQPPVDPDATSIAPTPARPAEDATSLPADFGPSPTPAPDPPQAHEPPQPHPAPESRGTMTGRLADLTQRHSDTSPADFGPGTAGPALPPSAPPPTWTPQPDPPTAATPPSSRITPAPPTRSSQAEPPTAAPTSSSSTPAPSPPRLEPPTAAVPASGTADPASSPPPQPELPARGTTAPGHPARPPQPEPSATAASADRPADPAPQQHPKRPQPEPPTATAPAGSTADPASFPPQPQPPTTSTPAHGPAHPARPPQPEPSATAASADSPADPAPQQSPRPPQAEPSAAVTPTGSTADSAPLPQPTKPPHPEQPTTADPASPVVTRQPATPPRSEPPTPVTPADRTAVPTRPPQSAQPTPPQRPTAAPGNTADSAPHPQNARPPHPVRPAAVVPPPNQDHWQPSFPARDTPTVPKLTPSAIDGFPAMPKAHEWEYDTAPRPSAEPQAQRWRGFAIAGIVAAVVGVGIGVLASREVATTPPVASTPPVTSSVSIPPGGDPAVAPVLTDVDDRGDEVELTWTDPTRGQAQFVLYDVTAAGGVPQPITGIAAGLTGFVVTGLDPRVPEYCFQLVAIGLTDPSTQRGASDRVCVSR
ncbi:protein kinase [Actinokineospora guangxiensis]|uniref:non-specific serine/threonine protein kinase n=1 Tax=Actinokineospora guangxiensis TaxID=1490288 RepID=A0ABW0ENK5_9PSEU